MEPTHGSVFSLKPKGSQTEKPWRKSKEEVTAQLQNTVAILKTSSQNKLNSRAIIFCYEANSLLDNIDSETWTNAHEAARCAVQRFQQTATNFEPNDIIETARASAAAALREVGLEASMRAVLYKSPPDKWPTINEIVHGIWCGGWAALNFDCRLLREKGITRVISVILDI